MRAAFTAAALALAAVALAQGEAEPKGAPPLAVTVDFKDARPGSALVPVRFLAPIAKSDISESGRCRLAGPPGADTFCQALPIESTGADALSKAATVESTAADGGIVWRKFAALVPPENQDYIAAWTDEPLSYARPVVSTVDDGTRVTLDTGRVRVALSRKRFTLFEQADVFDRPFVPGYVDSLVNSQQGLELVLTDRLRRLDITLRPEASLELAVEGAGPVTTTAVYRSAFGGSDRVPPVGFEARVTLVANGLVGLDVRIERGAFDADLYSIKALRLTLPVVLQRAASLSLGGTSPTVLGRSYWEGKSALAVASNGSYKLADADGSVLSGRKKATWADYRDAEAGIGIAWGARQLPAQLDVDYNEDLLQLSLTPRTVDKGAAEASVYFIFHPVQPGLDALPGLADALDNPLAATVDEEYIRALMGAK